MLAHNIRVEEDLMDQLFNSCEKRLARTLLLLARYGKQDQPDRILPKGFPGDPGGDDRNHTFACEFFHEPNSENWASSNTTAKIKIN